MKKQEENQPSQTMLGEIRYSLSLSIPLILTYLVQNISGFVANIFTARLGHAAMDAGILVTSLFATLMVFMFGILSSISVLVAQSCGAQSELGVRKSAQQGMLLSVIVGLLMMGIVRLTPRLLFLSGQSSHVIQLASGFLDALSWTMVPLGLLMALEQFLIGIGKTRIVFFVSVIEAPLEILCCYAFTFGHFGAPKLGIVGIGYGFVLAFFIVLIITILFTLFVKACRQYKLYTKLAKFNGTYLWELTRLGMPIGLMYIIELALYIVLAFMMGHVGAIQLAAHQIAVQYGTFTFAVIMGVSQAITVAVGHAVGRQDLKAVSRSAYIGMGLGLVMILLVAGCYWFMPDWLISIDLNIRAPGNQRIVFYTVIFFGVVGIAQLLDMIRFAMIGALRGIKDTKVPLYIGAVTFWLIGLPLSYLLTFYWHLGGVGLWWGLAGGILLGAMLMIWRFVRLSKRVDIEGMVLE